MPSINRRRPSWFVSFCLYATGPSQHCVFFFCVACLQASRRGKLAQLHGKLGKLLEAKIDAISTDGLQSGREAVRAKRKQLVKKSMRMQDQVEAVIKDIDGMLRKIRKEGETVARNLESLDIYKD